MSQPAAPTLSAAPKNYKYLDLHMMLNDLPLNDAKAQIEFDVPTDDASHAVIHVHDAAGRKQMYDAETQKVLPIGAKGKAVTLKEKGQRRTPKRKSLSITGLGGGTYTATVQFRQADDVDWGPTSPRSAPLVRALPPACGAPVLEAVSDMEIRVHFAVPQGCTCGDVSFYEDGANAWQSVDNKTCTLRAPGKSGPSFAVTGDKTIVVKGLSNIIAYTVKVNAHNGIGWGLWSPLSKPMMLADHQPPTPGVPVLDQVSADSVRVCCAVLPNCTHATIYFKKAGTGVDQVVDHGSGNKLILSGTGGGKSVPRVDCYKGVVVPGLSPDAEYVVRCAQTSSFGWSVASPSVKFRTLADPADEPEVIGVQTQEERDREALKRAVDVDADEDEPPLNPKLAKRWKN